MTSRNRQSLKIISAIVVIFLIVLIIHVLINKYLNHVNNQIFIKLNEVTSSLEKNDFQKAASQAGKLKKTWDKHADILPLFIDHNDIDYVTLTITQMESLINSGDDKFAIMQAETIKEKLENIKTKEILTLFNIF